MARSKKNSRAQTYTSRNDAGLSAEAEKDTALTAQSNAASDKSESSTAGKADTGTVTDTDKAEQSKAADSNNDSADKDNKAADTVSDDKAADASSSEKSDKKADESADDESEKAVTEAETDKDEADNDSKSKSKSADTKKGSARTARSAKTEKDDSAENDDSSEDDQNKVEAETKAPAAKKATPAKKTAARGTARTTRKKENQRVSNQDDVPINEKFKAKIIVVTSGKGGVGKTTSAAAISTGLALKGHKTVVIDFDVGLRNLDLIMGCERRVVYDLINVLHGDATLNQALIKDKHSDNLRILAASQTKDKDSLSYEGVGKILLELSEMGFEYIICDSPAGIEAGALIALYYADEAIITTNPEVSSVRDSDRIIGIIDAKSRRAVNSWDPVIPKLLLTRYDPERVAREEMLSLESIQELLTIQLLGVIPESAEVLTASNSGVTIIMDKKSNAGQAYQDTVDRILGNEVPMRFTTEKKSFFKKLLGK